MSARAYLAGLGRLFEAIQATDLEGRPVSIDQAATIAVEFVLGLRGLRNKAMLIGNGGSAAIVSHMQNDLFKMIGIRAMVFTEQPLLTALANDDGYETVFKQPIECFADPGDLLFAISSSGESESITSAVTAGRDKGCRIVTLSGFEPTNRLRQLGDVNLYVPNSSYGYVEMTHAILLHCVADFAMARKDA